MAFNPDDFSRFDDFDIHEITYKVVSGHSIGASVLIPKSLSSSEHATDEARPVVLRYHGGGFVGASRLFPDWFSPWLIALATRHNAVIVSPDYRLLPESTMEELLDDVEDNWKWIHSDLNKFVQEKTKGKAKADTSRILVSGESAGGYLSLMMGLSHPDGIRSVTAAYPMVDLLTPHFTEDYEKSVFGMPQIPVSVVEELVSRVKSGEAPAMVSSDPKFERGQLMFAIVQRGLYKKYFPVDTKEYLILDRLHSGDRFPRGGVFVLHGKGDSLVPVEGSITLAKTVEKLDPTLKFKLAIREGEHGFDGTAELDDEWLADGLKEGVASWLA